MASLVLRNVEGGEKLCWGALRKFAGQWLVQDARGSMGSLPPGTFLASLRVTLGESSMATCASIAHPILPLARPFCASTPR